MVGDVLDQTNVHVPMVSQVEDVKQVRPKLLWLFCLFIKINIFNYTGQFPQQEHFS